MSAGWLRQTERGSSALIYFFTWLSLKIGRRAGRIVVFGIAAYFAATSGSARTASRGYLSRVLGRRAKLGDIFRHYFTFSCTIHDRIFFLSGRFEEYKFAIEGEQLLLDLVERGQGCILLGSHLGSFEAMRSLGLLHRQLPLKVLMYQDNSRKVAALQNSLNPDVTDSIIPLGTAGSLLRVKEHVDQGGMVGILGDRSMHGEKTVQGDFFGRPARWPAGPLLLANTLGVPVVLFFCLYRGGRHYEIHFELLAKHLDIERSACEQGLQTWAARYAARLEHYCRLAPYNWFNFFDFWENAD